ncbi:MAG: hypothetical protein EOP47_22280 [Sphingobacteriaceae bacterium]|nr:MAG: hypothetical protein EOP47_22280 [Sphingobacteriaceae bacterium]
MADIDYNDEAIKRLRHDINNQLSNINLCLEHLKYEVENPSEDYLFYLETISTSCKSIIGILKNPAP